MQTHIDTATFANAVPFSHKNVDVVGIATTSILQYHFSITGEYYIMLSWVYDQCEQGGGGGGRERRGRYRIKIGAGLTFNSVNRVYSAEKLWLGVLDSRLQNNDTFS